MSILPDIPGSGSQGYQVVNKAAMKFRLQAGGRGLQRDPTPEILARRLGFESFEARPNEANAARRCEDNLPEAAGGMILSDRWGPSWGIAWNGLKEEDTRTGEPANMDICGCSWQRSI